MTLTRMQRWMQQSGYTYEKISEWTEIPVETVRKIIDGRILVPEYEDVRLIAKWIRPGKEKPDYTDRVSESAAVYGAGFAEEIGDIEDIGPYTLQDYYALPEDMRVELIDGYFFEMLSPTTGHQMVIGEIFGFIRDYIRRNKGKCIAFLSPMDVQLDCDDKTMVEPDVLIVCDRDKIIGRCIYGAPDFVVEVLSPSTRKKDITIKLEKYQKAGVREYWMVDLKKERIITCFFEEDIHPVIYGMDAEIPVKIYEGQLKIPFGEITESLEDIRYTE